MWFFWWGSQTGAAYSKMDLQRERYNLRRTSAFVLFYSAPYESSKSRTLGTNRIYMFGPGLVVQKNSTKIFIRVTTSRGSLESAKKGVSFLERVTCITLHLVEFSCIRLSEHHLEIGLRSFCKMALSSLLLIILKRCHQHIEEEKIEHGLEVSCEEI